VTNALQKALSEITTASLAAESLEITRRSELALHASDAFVARSPTTGAERGARLNMDCTFTVLSYLTGREKFKLRAVSRVLLAHVDDPKCWASLTNLEHMASRKYNAASLQKFIGHGR